MCYLLNNNYNNGYNRKRVASVISILIPFKDSVAYSISSKCRITGLSAGGVLMMWDRRALEKLEVMVGQFSVPVWWQGLGDGFYLGMFWGLWSE